jgi:CheY-like chemotaxis protein
LDSTDGSLSDMENFSRVILVVEDDPDDLFFLRKALVDAKVSNPMQVAGAGEEAVAYLGGSGKYADRDKYPWPTLVLLDLKLPRKPGLGVLRWMQKSGIKGAPVVVFTSSSSPEDVRAAYDAGAASYVVKPLNIDEPAKIRRAVEELLAGNESDAGKTLGWDGPRPRCARRKRAGRREAFGQELGAHARAEDKATLHDGADALEDFGHGGEFAHIAISARFQHLRGMAGFVQEGEDKDGKARVTVFEMADEGEVLVAEDFRHDDIGFEAFDGAEGVERGIRLAAKDEVGREIEGLREGAAAGGARVNHKGSFRARFSEGAAADADAGIRSVESKSNRNSAGLGLEGRMSCHGGNKHHAPYQVLSGPLQIGNPGLNHCSSVNHEPVNRSRHKTSSLSLPSASKYDVLPSIGRMRLCKR